MSYIFFYENYDIYKTEQLCASLYRLMETILIAKHLKKILVLPNFYFTPRNNELINSTNNLCIDRMELIDISNILQMDKIKEICECISLSEYMKLKVRSTIISKPNDDIPLVKKKYHTVYGILEIDKQIEIDYSSLDLLNFANRYESCTHLIIHNYNRMGNPIWCKSNKINYYKIRNSIKFNEYYYTKANPTLDFDNTLMVHWRRGDFKLSQGDTEETIAYYKKYNELSSVDNLSKNILYRCLENNLKSVFLLTNETNDDELNKLTTILEGFNIETIVYTASLNNTFLKYLITDICGIIIGSKCKYQLHGYGHYDRMSQYGRWIIEENMENKTYFLE